MGVVSGCGFSRRNGGLVGDFGGRSCGFAGAPCAVGLSAKRLDSVRGLAVARTAGSCFSSGSARRETLVVHGTLSAGPNLSTGRVRMRSLCAVLSIDTRPSCLNLRECTRTLCYTVGGSLGGVGGRLSVVFENVIVLNSYFRSRCGGFLSGFRGR